MDLFTKTTYKCSRFITCSYSTSFSLGIKMLGKKHRSSVYAVYGFVRYADEIVDTFDRKDSGRLLEEFRESTFEAVDKGISLNPVLHSFQEVVNAYGIEKELIGAFLDSMAMDLHKKDYETGQYQQYIYGSAEAVGLMCLRIFLNGDDQRYTELKESARCLGAAFQKVNFLRDLGSDFYERGRMYFPESNFNNFGNSEKALVEADIEKDFDTAEAGIKKLPKDVRLGVFLAYVYYRTLFRKIKRKPVSKILHNRIRIPNAVKISLLIKTWLLYHINHYQVK